MDVGHVLLKLPPTPKAEYQHSSPANEQLTDVRTKDRVHLSPRKLHAACAKLVHSSLLKHGVDKEQIHVSLSPSDLSMSVQLPCGWHAELVPCVADPAGDSDVYYVSRYRLVRCDVDDEVGSVVRIVMVMEMAVAVVVVVVACVCVCVCGERERPFQRCP